MMKRVSIGVVALLLTAAACLLVVYLIGQKKLDHVYEVPPRIVDLEGADLAEGRELVVNRLACGACHGDDMGGKIEEDDPVFATFVGTNLTSGRGGAGSLSVADWDRAIRYGVDAEGRALLLMPSHSFAILPDEQVKSVIAYIQSLAAVDRQLPDSEMHIVGTILVGLGKFKLDAQRIDPDSIGSGVAWDDSGAPDGSFIARTSSCFHCHGDSMEGYQVNPDEYAPPIGRAALEGWSYDDFVALMRTGTRPDGRQISDFMPWRNFQGMAEVELRALWDHLGQF